jgi:hypothetical protein
MQNRSSSSVRSGQAVVVGLMADPGLPAKVARSIAADLARQLSDRPDIPGPRWEVQVDPENLPLNDAGEIPVMEYAPEIRDRQHWDYLIYLTDLPRSTSEGPMLLEVGSEARAALVSLPALGGHGVAAKTRKLLALLIPSLLEAPGGISPGPTMRAVLGRPAARRVYRGGTGGIMYLSLPGRLNRVRLLAGMVRSNRPGKLIPALSNSIAAAAATGAFGIFYAVIWNMADALPPVRLALISVLAIGALSGWLIVHNSLWTRTSNDTTRRQAALDNAATVITVVLSVSLMYLILYAVLLCGALIVIASSYLETQLGHPVTLLDYAGLSWLAASLGTLAGALGSNFDSDDSIREATYSRREHQRRNLTNSYNEDRSDQYRRNDNPDITR